MKDIEEITKAIKDLKVAHKETGRIISYLTEKLEIIANDRPKGTVREYVVSLQEYKFYIGRRVRIVNPNKGEPNIGTITAVGKLYITVYLGRDLKRNRIAKNLRLLSE